MGFWSSLFGKRTLSFDDVRSLLDEADRLLDLDNPFPALAFMEKHSSRLPQEIVGPGGALHGRFLAVLFKMAEKVNATDENETAHPKVERNWANLPSVTMIPIGPSIEPKQIASAVKSSGKQLVCLIPFGADVMPGSAERQIELSYEFADDPQLGIMALTFNSAILIRASFFVEHASDIRTRKTAELLGELVDKADHLGIGYRLVER